MKLLRLKNASKSFEFLATTISHSGDVSLIERAPDWGGGDEGCCHPDGADDQDHRLCKVPISTPLYIEVKICICDAGVWWSSSK